MGNPSQVVPSTASIPDQALAINISRLEADVRLAETEKQRLAREAKEKDRDIERHKKEVRELKSTIIDLESAHESGCANWGGEGKGEILLYGNYIRKKEKAFGHSLTMQIIYSGV